MTAALKLVCALILCMLVAAPMTTNAMTCGQVAKGMQPCLKYLQVGGVLPVGCCNGIKTLITQAKTTTDRQTACNCLKTAAGSIRGLNPGLAAGLPGKCRVSIPYKISPSTDCKSVK